MDRVKAVKTLLTDKEWRQALQAWARDIKASPSLQEARTLEKAALGSLLPHAALRGLERQELQYSLRLLL